MQDIPRNELLDKLAAGWKVRRNDWENGVTITKHGGNASCHWVEMLKGDWEGEPPSPKKLLMNCFFYAALDFKFHNADKATHIRRMDWPADHKLTFKNGFQLVPSDSYLKFIKLECLCENDWEVWGYE